MTRDERQTEQRWEDGRSSASAHTEAVNADISARLPLDDPDSWERNRRGLVAREDSLVIRRDDGRIVWNADRFSFLDADAPATVNPSLWRQEQLNGLHGLFTLSPRIHQVRGYDLSNITFVRGEAGWIVIDPLTSVETASAALRFVNREIEDLPVTAVIFTHSHIDHFGGVAGVLDIEAGIDVPVIAPEGFLEAAVSENVIAGPAMLRRAGYMYGAHLPVDERGLVGCGLGRATPSGGTVSLVAPNDIIRATGEERLVDGVRIRFQLAPDTEAPAEMHFTFVDLGAICMAENCTCVMHNLYTPRGALVRDALGWSKQIHEALTTLDPEVDLCFASHNWPVFGNESIRRYLARQRDTYRYLHDQTMRLANKGWTPDEIADELELPASLADQFDNRGYYGTVSHNAKAVYQRYLGWFDGNPSHLDRLPHVRTAPRYVELMGGVERVVQAGRTAFDAGDYRWAAELLDHVVFAQPEHLGARGLLADTLEQLGYQAESGPWRNFYLTGAHELRNGVTTAGPVSSSPVRIMRAMTVPMIFDALAVRLDGPRADGLRLCIDWHFSDLDRSYALRLENAALHYDEFLNGEPDLELRLTHATLIDVLSGAVSPFDAIGNTIEADGDLGALVTLLGLLDPPDPKFAIVTP
jgi:alkyl sulfatase BDS1-like metallo-beta-lactamase superfamily hydrolase